jgi:hypothetical protein
MVSTSVLGMRPRLVIADDGVECGEQLAHDSDEGEVAGLRPHASGL